MNSPLSDFYTRKAIDLIQSVQMAKTLKEAQKLARQAEEYIRLEFYSRDEET